MGLKYFDRRDEYRRTSLIKKRYKSNFRRKPVFIKIYLNATSDAYVYSLSSITFAISCRLMLGFPANQFTCVYFLTEKNTY